jgi:hypothetical protein
MMVQNCCCQCIPVREAREGWPLLTVETVVNWDSKRTNERYPFLVGPLGLSRRYTRFLFCFGCSSRPSTNIYFLTVHYFNSFVPIAQQSGQAAVLGRLSLSVPGKNYKAYAMCAAYIGIGGIRIENEPRQ